MNTVKDEQPLRDSRKQLVTVLEEEEQFFLAYHHRLPVGREYEDVVDNAFDRLNRLLPLSYLEVADTYREMRRRYA
jgi:hypothetical protein